MNLDNIDLLRKSDENNLKKTIGQYYRDEMALRGHHDNQRKAAERAEAEEAARLEAAKRNAEMELAKKKKNDFGKEVREMADFKHWLNDKMKGEEKAANDNEMKNFMIAQ